MNTTDLTGIQVETFTPLSKSGVIVYLLREPIEGFDINVTPVEIDIIGNLRIHDMCLGQDGVHIGYLFKIPANARTYHNSIAISRHCSEEELLQADAYLVADIPGVLIYANEQDSILILSSKYENNITRNL